MQNSGQTTVVLFGNALDPRGRTNHPQPASPRPHGKPVAPVLAKNQPVWRSRPSKTSVTGRTRGGGLAHILSRHPDVVDLLPDRLAQMRVAERSENRIQLTDGEYTAVVRRTYDSKAKTWLLTAFEGLPRSERGRTASPSELRGPLKSRAAPGNVNLNPRGGSVETARDANLSSHELGTDSLPRSGRGSMGSPPELRSPLTSRAAPGNINLSPGGGSVETARDANANFRRLASNPLPHDEPEVVAASRAAAVRWEGERASSESPGVSSARGESAPASEPAESAREEVSGGGESVEAMLARKASPAELLAHAQIKAAYAAQQHRPSTDTLPGFGTPEFQAQREFIIDDKIVRGYDAAVKYLVEGAKAFSTKGPVKNEGIATILLGPPAAGKSTFSEQLARKRYAAIVDSDEAKKIIKEYNGGSGANAVHVESGELAALVTELLMNENANLVFPRVGADPRSIRQLITDLKLQGYHVDLVLMNVAPDEAFRRMIRRYLKTGRLQRRLFRASG
jgi:Zeta toxin